MCGIVGYMNVGQTSSLLRNKLSLSLRHLSHRGPDDVGVWYCSFGDCEIGIGHTRLSIIDLKTRANQPMHCNSGRFTISFNGEIYNYIEIRRELEDLGEMFSTNSDTEVLLNAWKYWGSNCLSKLDGLFAFAIYDSHEGVLTIVRDRNGMKPIYFSKQDNSFIFASEPAIVAKLAGTVLPNQQKVYEYLTMGLYDLTEETFFKNVYKLEPGFLARIEKSGNRIKFTTRKWSLNYSPEPIEISFESAVNKVRSLFLDSVSMHLRADVPVAVALSGGLDSSGIVGAIRKSDPDRQINTFSYTSPGFEKDESFWANSVSKSLNTKHENITLSVESARASIHRVVREQGEPTNSSSIIAQSHLYMSVAEQGFKVLLDGQGADELFAGYEGFIEFRLRSLLSERNFLAAIQLLSNWLKWSPGHSMKKSLPIFAGTYVSGRTAKYGARLVGRDPSPRWINTSRVKLHGINPGIPTIIGYPSKKPLDKQFLRQHLFHSLHGGDLQRLLRHGDRSSMAHSIESRLPYLGKNLVEFVNSLPESFLLGKNGETKHILRHALLGILSNDIIFRKDKIGFETPEVSWLDNLPLTKHAFEDCVGQFDWINPKILWNTTLRSSKSLRWRVLSLCSWAENFI